MSTSPDPWQVDASMYTVPENAIEQEMLRLQGQNRWMISSLGGVLSEPADSPAPGRVLDIGCRTGGWLLEMASTYPNIEWLIGIDVSSRMVKFARDQARARHFDERVEFHTMIAWNRLE